MTKCSQNTGLAWMGGGQPNLGNACILGTFGHETPPKRRSPRESTRWCMSCLKCWICDNVGDNIGCRGGDGCQLDGGGREERQGGVQRGKGFHQGVEEG